MPNLMKCFTQKNEPPKDRSQELPKCTTQFSCTHVTSYFLHNSVRPITELYKDVFGVGGATTTTLCCTLPGFN